MLDTRRNKIDEATGTEIINYKLKSRSCRSDTIINPLVKKLRKNMYRANKTTKGIAGQMHRSRT